MKRTLAGLIAALTLAVGLSGCAGTRVERSHPLLSSDAESARVYFIRPFTERYMGFADNAIEVEADRIDLLRLAKGEYTLVRVRPGTVYLMARSLTAWGPNEARLNTNTRAHKIKEMTHSQPFTFDAGQTYFVVFTPVDGEFRGVYYDMKAVDLGRARELSAHLRVVGEARAAPIDEL
jgi:hypothetical protein